jgi:hypothetical protein
MRILYFALELRCVMRRVAAFLTRLGVFAALAYVQALMGSLNPEIMQLDTRLLLSSCQIAIFAGMLGVYMTCRWIFSIMHSSRLYTPTNNASEFTESGSMLDDSLHADEIQQRVFDMPPLPHLPNVHTETASQISKGLVAQNVVIFADRDALGRHILQIYCLGFLLWATVYCFNYTLGYIFFHTSTGFILGYILKIFWEYDSLILSFYCGMLGLLASVTYIEFAVKQKSNDHWISMDVKDVLVGVCTPICIGIAWTSGFFFGSNNKFCLAMATEAFPVCLLCVMPIIWASPIESFQHFFLGFQIEMYLLSILVEPAIKFLAIYTMLLSLQTGNTIDVVIVVTCVAHVQMFVDVAWNEDATPLLIIEVILVSMLLVLRLMQYCYTDVFYLLQRRSQPAWDTREMECNSTKATPPNSCVDNLERWQSTAAHPVLPVEP